MNGTDEQRFLRKIRAIGSIGDSRRLKRTDPKKREKGIVPSVEISLFECRPMADKQTGLTHSEP